MGRVQDFLGIKRVVTEKFFYFNTSKGDYYVDGTFNRSLN